MSDPYKEFTKGLRKVGETVKYEIYDFGEGGSGGHISVDKETGVAHYSTNDGSIHFDLSDIQQEAVFRKAREKGFNI